MAARRTNLALLVLLALAFLTGGLAFGIGVSAGVAAVVAHGVFGLAILGLAPWKSAIARRGMGRRRSGRWASLGLSGLVVAAIVTGVLHSAGATALGPLTMMQLHVGSALASLPVALWHVVARPVKPRRTDLGRRTLLRAGALAGGAALAYGAAEATFRLVRLPGSDRRFTGSHERGSLRPEAMPVTQWLDDDVPLIEAEAWRLEVRDPSGTEIHGYEEIAAGRAVLRAVLDCTGGWFAEQVWEGVWLSELLPSPGRSVVVRSATGYHRRFPARDVPGLLLATRVGGGPLHPGHGFPARLVAPGRRGFWWVKWVTVVETDDRPWWWQSPFPLT